MVSSKQLLNSQVLDEEKLEYVVGGSKKRAACYLLFGALNVVGSVCLYKNALYSQGLMADISRFMLGLTVVLNGLKTGFEVSDYICDKSEKKKQNSK